MIDKTNIKRILGFPVGGKYLKIRSSDIFLVSYPKSGNTWSRFLIGNYLYGDVGFININEKIPDIHKSNNKSLNKIKSPRFIKSHFTYNENYPRVVYIKRDVKDVVVSYFYWFKKYQPGKFTNFNTYFEAFVKGDLAYGGWKDHKDEWINGVKKEDILIIDYGELKKNTFNEMIKIIKFCHLDLDEKKLIKAIEKSSFDSMKQLEHSQKNSEFFKNSNNSIDFVRSGGKLKDNLLNEEQIEILNNL